MTDSSGSLTAEQATTLLANIDRPESGEHIVPPYDYGQFVSHPDFISRAYFEGAFKRISDREIEVFLRYMDFDFDDGEYVFTADDDGSTSSWQACLELVKTHLEDIAG